MAVPPHPGAGGEARRGRAARSLDAVDVVEPVDPSPAPAARPSVDCLDESAAVAGAYVEAPLQEAHDGLAARGLGQTGAAHGAGAEVVADRHRHLTHPLPRAQPAAGERRRGPEERQPLHPTTTCSGNAGASPVALAVTRVRPGLGGAVSVTRPSGPDVALAPARVTVAPATGTP